MQNIISTLWLIDNINDVIIFDASSNFLDPAEGKAKYKSRHIENAFHIDLKDDMCGMVKEHGGRDPFPRDINTFVKKLESYGISNDSKIVVYDENLFNSTRFWIMCKYIGLDNIYILDGGINAWVKENYPLTKTFPTLPKSGKITVSLRDNIIVEIDQVRNAINDKNTLLIDSRSEERYSGTNETIDKIAGHIPNAKNYFFGNVLDDELKFKSLDDIKANFKDVESYKNIICYCGSGISANINIVALDEIGVKSQLYVGSWSDYITYME